MKIHRIARMFSIKTQQLWERIRYSIKMMIAFTRSELKQGMIILIYPRNSKQTRRFFIPYILLGVFLLISSASIFGSFFYHRTQAEQAAVIETLKINRIQTRNELKELTSLAQQLSSAHHNTQYHLNDIFAFLGNYPPEQLWTSNIAPPPVTQNAVFTSDNPDPFAAHFTDNNYSIAEKILKTLKQSSRGIDLSYNHLTNVENFLHLKQQLVRSVPNGWPLEHNSGYKTSGYGPRFSTIANVMEMHVGVDIAAVPGSKILAVADGHVEFAGEKNGYGQVVIIRHAHGYKSLYAHNRKLLVNENIKVAKGTPIAELGNSGRTTGSHLHIEIRIGNKPIDPWPYLVKSF